MTGKKYRYRHFILQLMLAAFLVFSVFSISPDMSEPRSYTHSSDLQQITTTDGDTTRIDYVDFDGALTIAADYGYATKIIRKSGTEELESYFDADGEPISTYGGYYSLLRNYDENGNITYVTYLDLEGEPFVIAAGYASEERLFDESGRIVKSLYYDSTGEPVNTTLYGYGRLNEYDDTGRVVKAVYIDSSGEPMMTGQGYASAVRTYYTTDGPERGKLEYEFYFDTNDEPVTLPLGHSGILNGYDENGLNTTITYVDEEGTPVTTKRGYSTIVRTFNADGTVASERYYDIKGDPMTLSEGQYGYSTESGKTVYLDSNGNTLFNIRRLLYNHSWIIIVLVLLFSLVSCSAGRKINAVFLVLYLIMVIYLTLMYRKPGDSPNGILLFRSFGQFFVNDQARADIMKNIWLFIPLGVLLYRLVSDKRIVFAAVLLSLIIEAVQGLAGIGFCEADDVLSNSLGGLIGCLICIEITRILQHKHIGREQRNE